MGPHFDDEEVIFSTIRLSEEGFLVDLATPGARVVPAHNGFDLAVLSRHFGPIVDVEQLEQVYDLIVIAGGIEGPDKIRQLPKVLDFIKTAHKDSKIIAAICHGPWVLISAKLLKGKRATCNNGMLDDLKNSGARFVDEAVVTDGTIITSRHPRDLGIFIKTILARFKK